MSIVERILPPFLLKSRDVSVLSILYLITFFFFAFSTEKKFETIAFSWLSTAFQLIYFYPSSIAALFPTS